MHTILYAEPLYPDETVEREVFGPDAKILWRDADPLSALSDEDCAAADGLMMFRRMLTAADLDRFSNLRAVVRMGVGYDRVDRAAAAARGVMVCNVPDYGTAEVCDHAMAMVLALRRGLLLHHEAQRADPPAAWTQIEDRLVQRLDTQRIGIVGLGRIGTAVALRARAFGFRVAFYDPGLPNGVDRALGIERFESLAGLLARSDVLTVHAPITQATRGLIGAAQLALLPPGAVVVNTARGPILDLDALAAGLRSGRIAGAGLDVIPVEPPSEPLPELLRAYRAREDWVQGRLIITPHSAFHSPQAWDDIRRKSAETMRAALWGPRPQNVISPDDL
jgi:C-terminal binding protein